MSRPARSSGEEQGAAGKAARAKVPRSSHAGWDAPSDRRSPVEVLREQDTSRVGELVPIRYGRMLASAFTFFRGAAAIMAADLATTRASGLEVQLCGDAHLSNFGVFAAPNRSLVFDCNDFDETLPGPFEWDVKRLAASLAVAGRDRGFDREERLAAARASAAEYRESMRLYSTMRDLDVWYLRIDVDAALAQLSGKLDKGRRKEIERNVEKAHHKDSLRAFKKLTRMDNGTPRIISDPPLITPVDEIAGDQNVSEALEGLLGQYHRTLSGDRRHLLSGYRYVHAARKVVGVGSVGTRAWIVLLLGRDDGDPLFLQAKEAQASVLEPYVRRSRFNHHGRRVVEGQRLMQAASDIFLGWVRASGIDGQRRDFYVRQLWDGKGSANTDLMSASDLEFYARLCGRTLARAHARSGDRIAIGSYLGSGTVFDDSIAEFAEVYADQNERDYEAVSAAAEAGRVPVATGL